ncbi:DNA polymerase III subunit chi [Alsobacter sp. SYSU M60028]|uniref:DNA polymerase III subunit chi n=1 Tax=Alsobacter ponti TaxID=2962936 RepID=A0ABT1LFK3_9HYPH|nr:DNA polymerase III subunit chi [Alsobacter ponti]MCP8940270.1 DNA polymerase III subunit chi [Alsobacter ponti]
MADVEVLFYHLERRPLEAVLPQLVEKSLERGWRVVVQASTQERLGALDDLLWTWSDDSFIPHAPDREPEADREPVVLTLTDRNPNEAQIRFLVEGAPLPTDARGYARIVLLFDGTDDEAVAGARRTWRSVREAGYAATYWQQSEAGRWEKKA